MTCPYCHKDSLDKEPQILSRKLCSENNLVKEYANPGGRELHFESGVKVQLTDCCCWCDYETLKKKLKESKND